MAAVMIDLTPLIIGSILVPLHLIIVLLLLRGQGGLIRAVAFVGGLTAVRLVQGLGFSFLVGAAATSDGDSQQGVVVPLLLLVLGTLLWVFAIRAYTGAPDPDDDKPQWMTTLVTAGPLLTFGFGALLLTIGVKFWVFTLAALGVIGASPLNLTERVTAYLLYVLLAQSLLFLPIIASAIAPGPTGATLEATGQWLDRYNRPIKITVSVIFGSYFLWKGISGLLE